jgi:hypothetical protein
LAIAACANSGCPTSGVEVESLLAMMITKYKEGDIHVKPSTVRLFFEVSNRVSSIAFPELIVFLIMLPTSFVSME